MKRLVSMLVAVLFSLSLVSCVGVPDSVKVTVVKSYTVVNDAIGILNEIRPDLTGATLSKLETVISALTTVRSALQVVSAAIGAGPLPGPKSEGTGNIVEDEAALKALLP